MLFIFMFKNSTIIHNNYYWEPNEKFFNRVYKGINSLGLSVKECLNLECDISFVENLYNKTKNKLNLCDVLIDDGSIEPTDEINEIEKRFIRFIEDSSNSAYYNPNKSIIDEIRQYILNYKDLLAHLIKEAKVKQFLEDLEREEIVDCISRVYLIKNTVLDEYKIGISNNPKNRFANIQTSNSCKLELLSYSKKTIEACKIETEIMDKFKNKRISGEWFKFSEEDVDYILNIIKSIE